MSELDAWSKLAAVAPSGAPPRHLAYVDGESVGFDVRMPLPSRCLTCGTKDDLSRSQQSIKLEADVETFLAQHLRGERASGVLKARDRVELSLPFCPACQAKQRQARHAHWIVRLSPLWLPAIALLFAVLTQSLGLGFLVGLGALIVALVRRGSLSSRYVLEIERIDADGIARVKPVHPDAAQAILVASGMQPAA